eukprot:1025493-Pleurochrysis_carterae.AAC.1
MRAGVESAVHVARCVRGGHDLDVMRTFGRVRGEATTGAASIGASDGARGYAPFVQSTFPGEWQRKLGSVGSR